MNKVSDDLIRKLAARWHLIRAVSENLDDQARGTFVGLDGGAGITTSQETLCGIECQSGLNGGGLGRVAFVAMLDKYRSYFVFEEIDLFCGSLRAIRGLGGVRLLLGVGRRTGNQIQADYGKEGQGYASWHHASRLQHETDGVSGW